MTGDRANDTTMRKQMNTLMMIRAAAFLLGLAAFAGRSDAQVRVLTAGTDEAMAIARVDELESSATVAGLAGSVVAEEAVERMILWLARVDEVRESLEANDGFIRSDDDLVLAFLFRPMEGESKLLRAHLPSVATAMSVVPETFYETLDATIDGLRAEADRLAPLVPPVTGVEADATMRAAIEKRIATTAPDARVLRTVLAGDRWSVRMTAAGVPTGELRRGWVIYRMPGVSNVVCQQLVLERGYFSGAGYTVRLGYLRLQAKP